MGEYEDKLKGKIKEVTGKITDDKGEIAEGLEEQRKGELKGELKETQAREDRLEREKLNPDFTESKK